MPDFPDAIKGASNVYKLVMENEKVRVLDVHFKPGDKAAMHFHPDHVIHILADAKLRLATPDGKSQEFAVKAGQTLWMEAGPHETTNIGQTESHNLVVEVKSK